MGSEWAFARFKLWNHNLLAGQNTLAAFIGIFFGNPSFHGDICKVRVPQVLGTIREGDLHGSGYMMYVLGTEMYQGTKVQIL